MFKMSKKVKADREYIKIYDNKHLIGKHARFKNNLNGYSQYLWLREGVIIQHEGLEHIGLSILFDKKPDENCSLTSCYIRPYSFELLEE